MQKMTLIGSTVIEDEAELAQYDLDAVGDINSKEASPQFFTWNRFWKFGGASSFEFSPITFSEESLPLGDS